MDNPVEQDAVPPEKETVYLVTNDRWQREPGGRRDPNDEAVLWQASEGGQFTVQVITPRQMLEKMKEEDADKFSEFHQQVELKMSKTLSFEELVEFVGRANERLDEFTRDVQPMTIKQAAVIRHVRVDRRMTWRAVASTCYKLGWRNIPTWGPPSNQVMGIALVQRAAELFGEDFRKDPWN